MASGQWNYSYPNTPENILDHASEIIYNQKCITNNVWERVLRELNVTTATYIISVSEGSAPETMEQFFHRMSGQHRLYPEWSPNGAYQYLPDNGKNSLNQIGYSPNQQGNIYNGPMEAQQTHNEPSHLQQPQQNLQNQGHNFSQPVYYNEQYYQNLTAPPPPMYQLRSMTPNNYPICYDKQYFYNVTPSPPQQHPFHSAVPYVQNNPNVHDLVINGNEQSMVVDAPTNRANKSTQVSETDTQVEKGSCEQKEEVYEIHNLHLTQELEQLPFTIIFSEKTPKMAQALPIKREPASVRPNLSNTELVQPKNEETVSSVSNENKKHENSLSTQSTDGTQSLEDDGPLTYSQVLRKHLLNQERKIVDSNENTKNPQVVSNIPKNEEEEEHEQLMCLGDNWITQKKQKHKRSENSKKHTFELNRIPQKLAKAMRINEERNKHIEEKKEIEIKKSKKIDVKPIDVVENEIENENVSKENSKHEKPSKNECAPKKTQGGSKQKGKKKKKKTTKKHKAKKADCVDDVAKIEKEEELKKIEEHEESSKRSELENQSAKEEVWDIPDNVDASSSAKLNKINNFIKDFGWHLGDLMNRDVITEIKKTTNMVDCVRHPGCKLDLHVLIKNCLTKKFTSIFLCMKCASDIKYMIDETPVDLMKAIAIKIAVEVESNIMNSAVVENFSPYISIYRSCILHFAFGLDFASTKQEKSGGSQLPVVDLGKGKRRVGVASFDTFKEYLTEFVDLKNNWLSNENKKEVMKNLLSVRIKEYLRSETEIDIEIKRDIWDHFEKQRNFELEVLVLYTFRTQSEIRMDFITCYLCYLEYLRPDIFPV